VILIVDNYDSFTFNLYQVLGALHDDVRVERNDALTVEQIRDLKPDGIVLSPGPGTPDQSGVCLDVLRELEGTVPLLGVCLGHQAICATRGARIVRGPVPVHGKPSDVTHDGLGLFAGLPNPLRAGRYHSLVVQPDTLPDELLVTATTADGQIMGVRHRSNPTWGLQFHPESILTPDGDRLLANFVEAL